MPGLAAPSNTTGHRSVRRLVSKNPRKRMPNACSNGSSQKCFRRSIRKSVCVSRLTSGSNVSIWRLRLQKEGIDDALIQPYSGHESRQSLEIYSRLSLADAQPSYNQAMERFPIQETPRVRRAIASK